MIALTAGVLFLLYLNVPAVAVRVHGAPFAIAAVVPLLLAIPVGWRILVRGEALVLPRALLAAVAMLGLHAISAISSDRPFESLDTVQAWLLEGVVLAFLIVNAVRTRAELHAAVYSILSAGAVMGLVALCQQLPGLGDATFGGLGQFDSAVVDSSGRVSPRLAGPIGETNRFAQIMAVLLPLAAGVAMVRRGGLRVLGWLGVFLIGVGVAFSFSRGAVVAVGLAVPFAVAFRMLRVRHVVLVGLAGVVVIASMPQYAERVGTIGRVVVQSIGLDPTGMRNADGAARGRLTEMKAAGMLFLDHPVLGAGPGLAPYSYEANAAVVGGKVRSGSRRSHNLYLQLAAETGLVGLLAFAFVVALVFRDLDRARRRFETTDRELWALSCGLALALVISLVSSLFLHAAYIRYFWMLIGVATAASAQPGTPALAAFLSRALRETAQRIRRDEARA